MKNNLICLLCFLFLLIAGCNSNPDGMADLSVQQFSDPDSKPAPPPGFHLGDKYVSALNETCYEAYASDLKAPRPQAFCLRDDSWVLLPQIYMLVPQGD